MSVMACSIVGYDVSAKYARVFILIVRKNPLCHLVLTTCNRYMPVISEMKKFHFQNIKLYLG